MTDSATRPEDLVAKWKAEAAERWLQADKQRDLGYWPMAGTHENVADALDKAAYELEAALRTPSRERELEAAVTVLSGAIFANYDECPECQTYLDDETRLRNHDVGCAVGAVLHRNEGSKQDG